MYSIFCHTLAHILVWVNAQPLKFEKSLNLPSICPHRLTRPVMPRLVTVRRPHVSASRQSRLPRRANGRCRRRRRWNAAAVAVAAAAAAAAAAQQAARLGPRRRRRRRQPRNRFTCHCRRNVHRHQRAKLFQRRHPRRRRRRARRPTRRQQPRLRPPKMRRRRAGRADGCRR